MQNEEKKYSIQLAAQMSGLTTHTIRAWEKRYSAITPERSDNGRRVYSEQEIDRLILLARLTKFGSNIGQIAGLSYEDLKDLEQKLNLHKKSLFTKPLTKMVNIAPAQERLINAVGKYQVQEISKILSELRPSVSPRTLGLEILCPLFKKVHELRSCGSLQDAQVQALLAIVRFHAGNIIYSHFEQASKGTNRLVLTSLDKEQHTFPLLISALLCCHHKLHFYYLNSNLPFDSILDATKATEANILLLSLPDLNSFTTQDTKELEKLIDQLSSSVRLWLLGDRFPAPLSSTSMKGLRLVKDHKELDELLQATL